MKISAFGGYIVSFVIAYNLVTSNTIIIYYIYFCYRRVHPLESTAH